MHAKKRESMAHAQTKLVETERKHRHWTYCKKTFKQTI